MDPVTWAAGAATLAAGVAGVIYIGRIIFKVCRAVLDIADDWRGEPARNGVDERPGVMKQLRALGEHAQRTDERLARVEKEVRPNGGSSMRDAIDRVEKNTQTPQVHLTVQPGAAPTQQGGSS